jgi:hypothetical protein
VFLVGRITCGEDESGSRFGAMLCVLVSSCGHLGPPCTANYGNGTCSEVNPVKKKRGLRLISVCRK